MGLFGKMFGKEEKKGCCDMQIVEVSEGEDADGQVCGCGCEGSSASVVITVMGPGCKRCRQLKENAEEAGFSVGYVTDPAAIADAGIMSTPALLVNGKVVSQGKVLSAGEIEGLV